MNENLEQLVHAIRFQRDARQVRAAARLMSLMENHPEYVEELEDHIGATEMRPPCVVGIIGPPGAGKSTLTSVLVDRLRVRRPEIQIGVIAIDPSSPFTGGAVLGDRVHMMHHATDEHVFIRSLASRGHLGGVSKGAVGVVGVMALIGCEVVFVETAGGGQSEVEIAQIANPVCVVMSPDQEESVQLLKAGLMEIADLFIVNKADRDGTDRMYGQLCSAIRLRSHCHSEFDAHTQPSVLLASATKRQGIDAILDVVEEGQKVGVE